MSSISSTVEQTAPAGSGLPPEVLSNVDNLTMEGDNIEPLAPNEYPNIDHLVTEDDTPVDNLFSAKQQRLLVESLYSSWETNQSFVADANVGVFSEINRPPIVPDMFLSLDVQIAEDWWSKQHRSYFLWEFGKPPDVVVEIVSNTKGQETGKKREAYARIGVPYYVIYDPQQLIQEKDVTVYELQAGTYIERADHRLERVGLKLKMWEGVFEGKQACWLRWTDLADNLIPTGAERAERLAAQLRALGVDPEA